MYTHSKTIFCDIDGCILKQHNDFLTGIVLHVEPLPQVKEKLLEWHCQGHRVILTTGRPGTMRQYLEAQLFSNGIIYDQLIMDCGSGARILINDIDPKFPHTNKALSINIERNQGIGDIYL